MLALISTVIGAWLYKRRTQQALGPDIRADADVDADAEAE